MRTIPFTIIFIVCLVSVAAASMIVVPVSIQYQGRKVWAMMAVDTGATTTTIGTDLANRLGIPRTGHGGFAEMADGRAVRYHTAVMDVSAGDMIRSNIEVNIMDYTGDRAVDGWLGMNFLSTMTMTIDWKNKRLYWSE